MVWLLFHHNHKPLQLTRHGESKYFGFVQKHVGRQPFFVGKWRNSTSYPQVMHRDRQFWRSAFGLEWPDCGNHSFLRLK